MKKSACCQLLAFVFLAMVAIDNVRDDMDWGTGAALAVAAMLFCTGAILKELGR